MLEPISREWVAQGDVLANVPIYTITTAPSAVQRGLGPALVVTHDCNLDKRDSDGISKIERIQFLPLRAVTTQDSQRQATLRSTRDKVQPAEVLWIGEVITGGPAWEAFVLLSEMYSVPAEMLQPEMQNFQAHLEADPSDPNHLVLRRHAAPLGRLSDNRLHLLHQKIALFFLREQIAD